MNNLKSIFLSTAALACMAFAACSTDDKDEPKPVVCPGVERIEPAATRIVLTDEQTAIADRLQGFSWRLFSQLHQAAPTANVLFSPYSIEAELGMLLNGMEGTGREELLQLLGFGTPDDIGDEHLNQFFHSMTTGIADETDNLCRFCSANSVWYSSGLTLTPRFHDALAQHYDAEFRPVQFSSQTAGDINAWCEEKTYGRIPTIVEQTTAGDLLYLVNAVHFLSKWADKFSAASTATFTTATGEAEQADMMKLHLANYGSSRYAYGDTYRAAAISFSSQTYSMLFILPDEGCTPAEVVADIEAKGLHPYVPENELVLTVPKFETTSDYRLANLLRQMGCTLFDRPESFCIFDEFNTAPDQIRHKAFLKIDEEGAEAAAATSTEWLTSPGPLPGEPIRLTLNRPFLYAIVENSTGFPLFLGFQSHVR